MNKKDEKISIDTMIADTLLRVKVLENLLISKGIISKEEYSEEMSEVTKKVIDIISQKSNNLNKLDN